jgi:hypothetical protein
MTAVISHLERQDPRLNGYKSNGTPSIDAIREFRPPFSPEQVVLEIAALAKTYGVLSAESDRWGGDWVVEAFRKHGIRVEPSAKPKSDLYREILPQLNAHACSLLDHPRMISQLCALERRTARGGRDSIDHPPMGHDDVANGVAGALVMAATGQLRMRISAEALRLAAIPQPGSEGWRRRFGY